MTTLDGTASGGILVAIRNEYNYWALYWCREGVTTWPPSAKGVARR